MACLQVHYSSQHLGGITKRLHSNTSNQIIYFKMFLCFILLLIYYIKPLHNCYNNKYEMHNLSDNLVLAVPLHSCSQGSTCITAYSTNSNVLILHAALSVTLFIGVTESKGWSQHSVETKILHIFSGRDFVLPDFLICKDVRK